MLTGSQQVKEVFSDKWLSKDTMGVADSSPYKKVMRRWMLEKYGWENEEKFKQALAHRSAILDAGCGLGREMINLAKAAPHAVTIGLEFSHCAVAAARNLSGLKNACVIQSDLLNAPFPDGTFDFLLAEGVLHHTPNTEQAFEKCCRLLRKGGEIAFYVYRKGEPIREFSCDYLRETMRFASSDERWKLARKITEVGKVLSSRPDLHRFVYDNFLKCFWNNELPFDENVIVNFDWITPEFAHRHTADEVRAWCKKNGLEITWFNEEKSGFSVKAEKRR
jgi:SAM-dependent methyltransferase